MPLRRTPQPTPAARSARRANALQSTGPRTSGGKQRSLANLKRHFGRLVGVPEALALDQEPGAAVHLYHELIAPYEPAPALLAMHFRDLARLQLELQAWEGIPDAGMNFRAEQTLLDSAASWKADSQAAINPHRAENARLGPRSGGHGRTWRCG